MFCRNIAYLSAPNHILIDVFSPTYDTDNAIYGSEGQSVVELWHYPLKDYDLVIRYTPYYSDVLYISYREWVGADDISCGRFEAPCKTFEYALER